MSYRINAYPVDLVGKRDLEIVGIVDSNLAERYAARLRSEIDASGKLVYRQVIVAAAGDPFECAGAGIYPHMPLPA
ncbi:hypothetical protein C5615_29820 [Burkholderia cepacia]|uniref:Uncharacterized protein n=1 Tax=Burkholderia cepacia TaxID=292 RepID=A0A2S8IFD2_BURCE|nr:hypothetical protein [Burkholderia cepacia]PQP13112.1 hypothetical protein C5615_29820 [Burkholderia cepacia]HDR9510435.1 hypothetical protein [Burkholderia cepacia]